MKITIPYCYTEEEIPPRCRKPRRVEHVGEIGLAFHEVTAEAAPVAIVHHYEKWGKGLDRQPVTAFYRWWRNRLYARKMISRYVGDEDKGQTAAEFAEDPYPRTLDPEKLYHKGPHLAVPGGHTSYAGGWYQTKAERRRGLMAWARSILFIDGERWGVIGEPCYEIATFGLGCNHGGTAVFVQHHYNPNVTRDRYFRLDERDKALATATTIAERRGDTKDAPVIETNGHDTFEILIPEAIQLNPKKEHGTGDPFINQMEGIIESTKEPAIAGLMGMAIAFKGLSDRA